MNDDRKRYVEHIGEWLRMMRERKKVWLAPLIFILLLLGTLIFALEGSIVAPLIYTIF